MDAAQNIDNSNRLANLICSEIVTRDELLKVLAKDLEGEEEYCLMDELFGAAFFDNKIL